MIIVGKEKEITLVDSADRTVTVKKPIERIVILGHGEYDSEVIRMFGSTDEIVGVTDNIIGRGAYFPELSKLPSVGMDYPNPDYETIISLNPDLVTVATWKVAEVDEKLPDNIAVVGLDFYRAEDIMKEEVMKLAYILGKKDEARHYIDEFHDEYLDPIKARTEGLSDEEKPKVYYESRWGDSCYAYCGESSAQQYIGMCGGMNIFADIPEISIKVDPEEIIMRNPDIIIRVSYYDVGYEVDDPSQVKAVRDEIMSRPELANVNAVKNGRVYITDVGFQYGPDYPIAMAYFAKWFHPELFEDLDPKVIHQEWLTEFQGLDYDLDKHGVFVYHPEEHPEGK